MIIARWNCWKEGATEENRLPFLLEGKINFTQPLCRAVCCISFHLLPSMRNGNRLPNVEGAHHDPSAVEMDGRGDAAAIISYRSMRETDERGQYSITKNFSILGIKTSLDPTCPATLSCQRLARLRNKASL